MEAAPSPGPRPVLRGPRLYALHPLLVGALPHWDRAFAHAAGLGFDAVLVSPAPFAAGEDARLHPILEARGDAATVLGDLAARARGHGLSLYLDLALDRVAEDGALAAAHPGWFAPPVHAGLPDPRLPPAERGTLRARWRDPAVAEALGAWWLARLQAWTEAGVAGFRCLDPAALPAGAWRALAGSLPEARFLAWAPGLPAEDAAALRGGGFAGAFDSLAWWRPGESWLAEEHARLAGLAPLVLATVEAPFGPRLAGRFDEAWMAEAAAVRQVRLAAGIGAGMLMPMGFEFGARRALDPARDRPGDWQALLDAPSCDLCAEVRAANAVLASRPLGQGGTALRGLTGPGAPVAALLSAAAPDARAAEGGLLVVANAELQAPASVALDALLPAAAAPLTRFRPGWPGNADGVLAPGAVLHLAPGEARLLIAERPQAVVRAEHPPHPAKRGAVPDEAALAAAEAPRVAIEAVAPAVDAGRFAVKRVAGEVVEVTADILMDGHEQLAAALLWRPADEAAWREVPMRLVENDRWAARFPLERVGLHHFAVEAWHDVFGSFRHGLELKHAAGQDVTLELEEGRRLVAAAAERAPGGALAEIAARLAPAGGAERLHLLLAPETTALMAAADPRRHRARSAEHPVEADRAGARFASWYEMFPRNAAGGTRHGSFRDVIAQLPRIRAMGFDVLYFPPIHPIGRAHRKGRNNTLTPAPADPGSPYAIGSEAGGHEAVHPELGTLGDFRALRAAAEAEGIELALDFAIQCSPDHPWLREHPDWFDWRPDGTIKYAENPPKKYQDIVNVDFYAPGAVPGLWAALRDTVRFWVDQGVRLFRVDNPHTKPLPFWEWMIAEIRARDPDVVFLAEAFTRPKMMYRLAKVGFGQSYTYFTWRNEKREITEYLEELNAAPAREVFRPHFFVNTPDINPVFLQEGGRGAHLIRLALAATLSGLWGMCQGFELCEATPLPGREEYLDSDKYEIRAWPERRPGDIVAEITRLNAIRRANPALQTHLGLRFLPAFNDRVLFYRKATADRSNVVLCAVSLDPAEAQEAVVELPLREWGLPDDAALEAEDLMRDGHRFTWHGTRQRVRLDPHGLPFGIWRVRPQAGGMG